MVNYCTYAYTLIILYLCICPFVAWKSVTLLLCCRIGRRFVIFVYIIDFWIIIVHSFTNQENLYWLLNFKYIHIYIVRIRKVFFGEKLPVQYVFIYIEKYFYFSIETITWFYIVGYKSKPYCVLKLSIYYIIWIHKT